MAGVSWDDLARDVGDTIGGAIGLVLRAVGLHYADYFLLPQAKKCMIMYFYIAPILFQRVRDPTFRKQLRICAFVAGPFIPCPYNFTTIEPLVLAYNLILPPVSRWMKLEGGDDVIMGLLVMGIFKTSSFIFTVVFLRYSHSIWGFLFSAFLRQMVVSSLLATGTAWFLWSKVFTNGQKGKLKTNIWKTLGASVSFMITCNDTIRRSFVVSTKLLNQCELAIINRLELHLWKGKKGAYKYASFENSRTIRLVKLNRRKPFTSMKCDIIEVLLDEAPPFEALSYTWQNEQPSVRIPIGNDSFVVVTPAVGEFLHYRHTFIGEMLFWIDGVCINQASNEDKNQQVPLMRDIYTRASRVVVWLGPMAEAEDAHLAREKLFYVVGSRRMLNKTPEDLYTQMMKSDGSDGWKSLLRVFEHPWFSRVWVVQEVALASRVDVMYGSMTIGWQDFAACIEILSGPFLAGPAQIDDDPNLRGGTKGMRARVENLSNARVIAHLHDMVQAGQIPSLASVLMDSRAFKSTNARDKIYGLLGIISDQNHPDLVPDYNYSEIEVFVKTANYLLSQSDPPPVTHMFQRAGTGFGRSVDMVELPSWIPDWKGALPGHFLDSKAVHHSNGSSGWKATMRFTDDPKLIQVCGASVDRIKQVSAALELDDLDMRAGHTIVPNLYNQAVMLHNTSKQSAYKNSKALEDAIYGILLGTETSDTDFSQSTTADLLNCMEIQRQGVEALKDMPAGEEVDRLGEQLLQLAIILTPFACRIGQCCFGKSMVMTDNGRLGFAPPLSREGDLVCYFQGLPRPFVLREKKPDEGESVMQYELIGGCYIDDLMNCHPVIQEHMWFPLV